MTKAERLAVFSERLRAAPAASSADEAVALVATVLNAVEDEFSGAPFDPTQWTTDGRMYPAQADRTHPVEGHPGVVRQRTVAHFVYVRTNGAIEIRSTRNNDVIFQKPGADGLGVW